MSTLAIQHRFLWAGAAGLSPEPCPDLDCRVSPDGLTSCGSIACPMCGRGGVNLSITQLLPAVSDAIVCGCGHRWRIGARARLPRNAIITTAELAECSCPEFCERDHQFD